MLMDFEKMGVSCLCIILITPIASGNGTIVCTPIAFMVVAGMFVAILMKTWAVQKEIKEGKISDATPTWINDCLDIDLSTGTEQNETSALELNDVANSIMTLSILMIIFIG